MYFRDFIEDTAPGSRKKGRRRKPLSSDDLMQIGYKALCKGELRKDVAKEMRVTPQVVSRIVMRFKKEKFLQEIEFKEQHADMKLKVVKAMVNKILEEDKIVDSAESVCNRIKEEVGIEISFEFVRGVMTDEMGMRYRKIVKASYHSNSP